MNHSRLQRLAALWALGLFLAAGGCTLQPANRAAAPAEVSAHGLKAWRLEGRIGVKTQEDGWTANLFWEHDSKQDRLRISGPFSQGMVSIVVQDDLIYLNEGHGVERMSRDPDAMLRERLGFAVPLRSLRYWVTGVPAPDSEYVEEPASATARRFQQQGWSLAYERFSRVGSFLLPQRATISGNDVRLRLIADEWNINE